VGAHVSIVLFLNPGSRLDVTGQGFIFVESVEKYSVSAAPYPPFEKNCLVPGLDKNARRMGHSVCRSLTAKSKVRAGAKVLGRIAAGVGAGDRECRDPFGKLRAGSSVAQRTRSFRMTRLKML
jgi:hypothetical protein